MTHIAELVARNRVQIGWLSIILFILTIPLGNWVVMNVGYVCPEGGPCLVPVWPGIMSPSSVLIAGIALVLRDAVHHFMGGKWAVYAIFAGAVVSGLVSDLNLIVASTCAFVFSELADFAVYAPMRKRFPAWAVIASGLVGSVVDSCIFLSLAFGSLEFVLGQVIGKVWVSLIVGLLIAVSHRIQSRMVPARQA
jgi:uncharacterized PurR-regulated membrane protein YhhQ (DUF165 family)